MTLNEHCEKLVQQVKATNLHLQLSENQISLKICIRKKFIENEIPAHLLEPTTEALQTQIKLLEQNLKFKSTAFDDLETKAKNLNAELLKKSDELFHTKNELTKQQGVVKEMSTEIEILQTTSKNLKSERLRFEKQLHSSKKDVEKKEVELIADLNKAKEIIERKETKIKDMSDVQENLKMNC